MYHSEFAVQPGSADADLCLVRGIYLGQKLFRVCRQGQAILAAETPREGGWGRIIGFLSALRTGTLLGTARAVICRPCPLEPGAACLESSLSTGS